MLAQQANYTLPSNHSTALPTPKSLPKPRNKAFRPCAPEHDTGSVSETSSLGQPHAGLTNTHRSLHKVISAGDFGGEGAAPVSHVVPVSLWREEGGKRLTVGPAHCTTSVWLLRTELRELNAAQKKGSNCGYASTTGLSRMSLTKEKAQWYRIKLHI